MNLSQIVLNKSKNMGFFGFKNKNSRNIESPKSNKNNSLLQNHNVNSFFTKGHNEKLKFTINKKNLLNTINRLLFVKKGINIIKKKKGLKSLLK